MKTSFIATVFNEQTSINEFIRSILTQKKFPDEIIIVDGGSTDKTFEKLKEFKNNIILFQKKGNRSVCRNYAISKAKNSLILISDAGCVLEKNWVKNIVKPFQDFSVDVVAGYYKGKAKTLFQKCLIPYILVMENKINPSKFLPSTRSMAMRKKVWDQLGGFREDLFHNEDYVFSKKLETENEKVVFQKDAIVYWIPPKSIKEAFIMFFRFAYGDVEADIYRSKVIFLIVRYLIGLILLVIGVLNYNFIELFLLVFVIYLIWSILKNYKYINSFQAIIILPFIQLLSDLAVLSGTIIGQMNKK